MADASYQTTFIGARNQGSEIGHNSGNIYNYFQEPSATNTPSSFCDVPDLLSLHFLGRETELAKIQDAFEKEYKESPSRCVVYGMHGVGKTQLALKYAEYARKENQCPYIFWMPAASEDKLVGGFSRLCDALGLGNRQALDQRARCVAARIWLEDTESQTKRRWLLVLDNTSQEAVTTLRQMLPRGSGGGKILLTTRTKQTAEDLAIAFGERHACLDLAPLGVDHSVHLLLRVSGPSQDRQSDDEIQAAEHVVKCVGCLPLAVDQAASLMEACGTTAQEIAQIYQSEQIEDALQWENDLSRYEESSVIATYSSTLKQLEGSPPGTCDLLRILAFMDPESIPIEILKQGCRDRTDEDLETVQLLLQNTVTFQKAMQSVQRLSLATQQNDGKTATIRIHDLVHLVLRTKLMSSGDERKRWLGHAISTVYGSLEKIKDPRSPACWEQCERFVAQGQALQRHGDRHGLVDERVWAIRLWVAQYLTSRGRYEEAENIKNDILIRRQKALGPEHLDTLDSMDDLATTYMDQGRLKEAEELEIQVIETTKRVFGANHPSILITINNLALIYLTQGRWKQAEELFIQVIETCKIGFGAEHTFTLTGMDNLASTYRYQGRWTEAEQLFVQVIKIRKTVLGTEHPDTLTSMHNLALAYWGQSRLKKGKELEVQVIEIRKRVLGADHPSTLSSTATLASMLRDQGQRKEAEELYMKAIDTGKRMLRAEYPFTLVSMNSLASIYCDQGRWKEAEDLEVQVTEMRKKMLGADHPDTLFSMVNLALIRRGQGRWKEAEDLEVQVMEVRERVLGADHPDTLTSMSNLALTLKAQGKIVETIELMIKYVQARTKILVVDHLDTSSFEALLEQTERDQ